MGKVPYYTDTEESSACSSVENVEAKPKKRFSILKYTTGKAKKKKCAAHSVSDPEESEWRTRSSHHVRKLRGILKHDRDKESSEEEEDLDVAPARPRDQYLVGRVPRGAGCRAGRGGGVAILIRKNADVAPMQSLRSQPSNSSMKRRRYSNRIARKQSY